MMADDGWRFCKLGQQLERAIITANAPIACAKAFTTSRRTSVGPPEPPDGNRAVRLPASARHARRLPARVPDARRAAAGAAAAVSKPRGAALGAAFAVQLRRAAAHVRAGREPAAPAGRPSARCSPSKCSANGCSGRIGPSFSIIPSRRWKISRAPPAPATGCEKTGSARRASREYVQTQAATSCRDAGRQGRVEPRQSARAGRRRAGRAPDARTGARVAFERPAALDLDIHNDIADVFLNHQAHISTPLQPYLKGFPHGV